MKKKIEMKRAYIWWSILGVTLICCIFALIRYNMAQVEASEKALKEATASRREAVEKDFSYQVALLELLCSELDPYSSINEEEQRQMDIVKKQIDSKLLGVYKAAVGSVFASGDVKLEQLGTETYDRAKQGLTSVVRLDSAAFGGKELYCIAIPWFEDNEKFLGIAFAAFELEDYMSVFSASVHNGSGYGILCNERGEIIVPANQIITYNTAGEMVISDNFTTEKVKEMLVESEKYEIFLDKVFNDGKSYYVHADALNKYPGYIILTVVDKASIFENISPVARIVMVSALAVLLLLFLQSMYVWLHLKRKKREISRTYNYDELTGLPSKQYHKTICTNLMEKKKAKYAYAVCNVCEFKFINSGFGYEYGNTVLKHIAECFKNNLDKDEALSRTNADLFAMLLKYETIDELTRRLEGMLEEAAVLPEAPDGRRPRAIFTCGVYILEDSEEEEINRIRARANVARKGIKRSINSQIAYYSDDDFKLNQEAHEMEDDLAHCIEHHELEVFLQPKYGISDETVIGAEALVRWNHRDKGMISPAVFIPIAERNGFVRVIDFYVFDTVCKKLKEWEKMGKHPIRVSVNFSRVHLLDDDFVARLISIAKDNKVKPEWLEIELTETAIYDEMGKLLDTMYRIKEAGFGLSMDDFGSGYSSLHLLREMPVDVLKLDKGFLDNVNDDNEREKKVISHVISMAKDLNIHVLAEGVETESQKAFLKDANCDMIQGYYYAKPMPMSEFEAYLK